MLIKEFSISPPKLEFLLVLGNPRVLSINPLKMLLNSKHFTYKLVSLRLPFKNQIKNSAQPQVFALKQTVRKASLRRIRV